MIRISASVLGADLLRLGEEIEMAERAGVQWLQGLLEIVMDPERGPAAAREFSEYEYERAADGTVVQSYPDRDNHAIDAVRYAMNRVWQRAGQ